MSDLLKTGSDWLSGQLKSYASQSVTYARGAYSVTVDATVGRTIFDPGDGVATYQKWESRDYLIDTADLILNGSQTLPARGDTITETIGGVSVVYEVTSPKDTPHFVYSDAYRKKLRIHTSQVS